VLLQSNQLSCFPMCYLQRKLTSSFLCSNSYNTNFHDVHTIEDWLGSINMARYATHFANAGYMDLGHVKSLEEEDLSRIGVKLIGHRNKINKSIKAMNKHFESLESDDSEKQTFV
ncbi:Ephrin type-A receptor 4, partial [Exaiptasia diaphana]